MRRTISILLAVASTVSVAAQADGSPAIVVGAAPAIGYRYQVDTESVPERDWVSSHWFFGGEASVAFGVCDDSVPFVDACYVGFGASIVSVEPAGQRYTVDLPVVYLGDPRWFAVITNLAGGVGFDGAGGLDDIHFGIGAGVAIRSLQARYTAIVDIAGSVAHRMSVGYVFSLY